MQHACWPAHSLNVTIFVSFCFRDAAMLRFFIFETVLPGKYRHLPRDGARGVCRRRSLPLCLQLYDAPSCLIHLFWLSARSPAFAFAILVAEHVISFSFFSLRAPRISAGVHGVPFSLSLFLFTAASVWRSGRRCVLSHSNSLA